VEGGGFSFRLFILKVHFSRGAGSSVHPPTTHALFFTFSVAGAFPFEIEQTALEIPPYTIIIIVVVETLAEERFCIIISGRSDAGEKEREKGP